MCLAAAVLDSTAQSPVSDSAANQRRQESGSDSFYILFLNLIIFFLLGWANNLLSELSHFQEWKRVQLIMILVGASPLRSG